MSVERGISNGEESVHEPASQGTKPTKSTSSPLLRLPTELRVDICEPLLGHRSITLERNTCHTYHTSELYYQRRELMDRQAQELLGYWDIHLFNYFSEAAQFRIKVSESFVTQDVIPFGNSIGALTTRRECSYSMLERMCLDILKTCQTLYNDACLIPYKTNNFEFRDAESFCHLLFTGLDKPQIAAIRTIYISCVWDGRKNSAWNRLLRPRVVDLLSGLRTVHISIVVDSSSEFYQGAWTEEEHFQGFLELKNLPLEKVTVVLRSESGEDTWLAQEYEAIAQRLYLRMLKS